MVLRLGEWGDCNKVCAQRVQAQVEVQVVLKQAGGQMIRRVCSPLYPDFFTRLIWGFQQSSWPPPRRTDTHHFGIPVGVRKLTGGTLLGPLSACDLCAPAPPTALMFPQSIRLLSVTIMVIASLHSYSPSILTLIYHSDIGASYSIIVFEETCHISVTLLWAPLD